MEKTSSMKSGKFFYPIFYFEVLVFLAFDAGSHTDRYERVKDRRYTAYDHRACLDKLEFQIMEKRMNSMNRAKSVLRSGVSNRDAFVKKVLGSAWDDRIAV